MLVTIAEDSTAFASLLKLGVYSTVYVEDTTSFFNALAGRTQDELAGLEVLYIVKGFTRFTLNDVYSHLKKLKEMGIVDKVVVLTDILWEDVPFEFIKYTGALGSKGLCKYTPVTGLVTRKYKQEEINQNEFWKGYIEQYTQTQYIEDTHKYGKGGLVGMYALRYPKLPLEKPSNLSVKLKYMAE